VLLLVLLLGMGYCGYAMFTINTEDVPKLRVEAVKFLEFYNSDQPDQIYGMADSAFKREISVEKSGEQFKKVKEMVGKVTLGELVGWSANNINGNRYLSVSYACDGEKGKTIMTLKFHKEDTWKIQGYHFKVK
jgi:hypothetical protein